ncbi:LANO_0G03048g1_1 [Lachancea nothofagi CBS 11611]|uniref:LANO_0G03048g1_1 n=1 Tax=Lachancea nothofagi CBS 11611 TaxID=1266666 RepID=A0A1G4KFI6_9SACH|nr:LANO_0G03048g1_1 [Lachancea nothofagi CBS 11611]
MLTAEKKDRKKALRTCVRCRRNKIKCDLQSARPKSCTACEKRRVECVVDYVVPHQRSQELLSIVKSVEEMKKQLQERSDKYETMGNQSKKLLEEDTKNIQVGNRVSKIIKIGDDDFILITLAEDELIINNCTINLKKLEDAMGQFRDLVGCLLNLYSKWEVDQSCVSDSVIDERTSRYSVENLFFNDQLPLLLCLVNFYFDVGGLKYENLFDQLVDDYCVMAIEDDKDGVCFDRRTLSNYIVGETKEESGTHFNGEIFIKKLTLFLFYHIVLYGFDHYMDWFMDRYIKTLENVRKKVNIEKNWEVKWVNFYIKIFDLIKNLNRPVRFEDDCGAFLKVMENDSKLIKEGRVSEGFVKSCLECYKDMVCFTKVGKRRIAFFTMFIAQFVTLNLFVVLNNSDEGREEIKQLRYTGFNGKDVLGGSYEADVIGRKTCLEKGNDNIIDGFDGCVVDERSCLNVVHRRAFERCVRIDEDSDAYSIVFEALSVSGQRRMLESCSCKMVTDLYQRVVVDGMVAKVFEE